MAKTSQDEIIAAARYLFRTRGYAGTSIGDVADAVGLRKASIYSRFDSKLDLARAAVALTAGEFALPDDLPADLHADWRAGFAQVMRAHADRLADARRCLGLHLLYDETLPDEIRHDIAGFFAALRDGFEKVAAPSGIARELAQEAVSVLEGGLLWLILDDDRAPLDRMIARFCADLPAPADELRDLLRHYGIDPARATGRELRLATALAAAEGENITLRGALAGQAEAESCFR
ncbi:MAG: helix-turn-helix domain-containing protein [Paracoccus sp. (in: a-proteobacteria)]|nr:helix-turn-helix domain-containing protein [Paracoccus sp. (in: a-proteobacteria)]